MAGSAPAEVEEILNSFTEIMSGLMIDQYQKQITELELTLPQAQVLRVLKFPQNPAKIPIFKGFLQGFARPAVA